MTSCASCGRIYRRAASCTSTTTTAWTVPSGASSRGSSRARSSPTCRSIIPIYHLAYEFPRGIPKIHEHDGKPAQGLGLFLNGRLVVYYSYQSDLGDGWEDPEVHKDPPEKHEAALRMGVNLYAYAVGFGG